MHDFIQKAMGNPGRGRSRRCRGRTFGVSATNLRRAIARTPLAPIAAFPKRLARVARHDARVLGASARWLFTSREHHNYTYDLTRLSREHLAWFVSEVCDIPVAQIRGYFVEIECDAELRGHIERATAGSARRGLADRQVRYARRIGWYALVRAAKPAHVVETGVDKGLGTCVIAAALLRNGAEGTPGRVTSLDINPEAGYLAKTAPWNSVVDLVIGDSIASIGALDKPVDIFLHDSDHSVAHERREFQAVEPKLSPGAVLLTDNVAVTNVLAEHAEATGRRFLAYREQPARHWFPGDGIGAAW
jgi:predicted O-methyltransferase YrrM